MADEYLPGDEARSNSTCPDDRLMTWLQGGRYDKHDSVAWEYLVNDYLADKVDGVCGEMGASWSAAYAI
ncbi:MAG: hypothetical protein HKM02_03510 [Pseudomonadales bacterium]|nr:hypothetical protein [Pseudomonadales bacterium]